MRLLFLLCCLVPALASAQSRCIKPDAPWSCVGTFELRLSAKGEEMTVRMIRYDNGESMVEIDRQGVTKRYLSVLPSSRVIYSGLTADESPHVTGNNPFMFLDMPFAYVFMALHLAHPAGPASVPDRATETAVTVEKQPTTITATRVGPDRVEFRLKLEGDVKATIDSVWDGRLAQPLPDDLPIGDWRHTSATPFATLRDARAPGR